MATDVLAGPTIMGTGTRTKVYKNFIDGEWVEASTGQTFENRNPADTRDVVGIFQRSGKADVETAIAAAKRAFAKWRLVPAPRRAEIIYRAAEMLMERKEECARDMTREMGKILKETRGDVQEAVDTAYYMAGGAAAPGSPGPPTPAARPPSWRRPGSRTRRQTRRARACGPRTERRRSAAAPSAPRRRRARRERLVVTPPGDVVEGAPPAVGPGPGQLRHGSG